MDRGDAVDFPFAVPLANTRASSRSPGEDASGAVWDSSQMSTPLRPSRPLIAQGSRTGSPSPTASSLSLSDAELAYQDGWSVEAREWPAASRTALGSRATSRDVDHVESLPFELLIYILQHLPTSRDLLSAMLVSKSWCMAAFPLVWQRPSIHSITQFAAFVRALCRPSPLLPYATSVRRLVFNGFARHLTDDLFLGITACRYLERLTLPGADRLSTETLLDVFGQLPDLISIDLSGMSSVTDAVVKQIASYCLQLQGLNLSRCKNVGDDGILAIAGRLKMLRRIKMNGCHRLTDRSIVALSRHCSLLLELDLAGIPQLTNDTTISVFLNSSNLRELKMNDNRVLSAGAIPDLDMLARTEDRQLFEHVGAYPWYLAHVASPKAMWRSSPNPPDINPALLRPVSTTFDQLRIVDFTSCSGLTDEDVDHLVRNAPQLRTLTLTKCVNLTDFAVETIMQLGKFLHYLHLGHVNNITDDAVVRLARSCTRLRYVDVANCSQLTDASVVALATSLPKLRRIGLVKVTNVTDAGILPLAERYATLERIHLSYCDKITVKAIAVLLNRLPLLTHLSLTGINCFKTPELQQFCRPPPDTFTAHQRASFCVYSGDGVVALRNYLNSQATASDGSDDSSPPRRSSESSSSSLVLPGPPVSSTAPSWIGVQGRRRYPSTQAAPVQDSPTSRNQLATAGDPDMNHLVCNFAGSSLSGPGDHSQTTNRHIPSSQPDSIAGPTSASSASSRVERHDGRDRGRH